MTTTPHKVGVRLTSTPCKVDVIIKSCRTFYKSWTCMGGSPPARWPAKFVECSALFNYDIHLAGGRCQSDIHPLRSGCHSDNHCAGGGCHFSLNLQLSSYYVIWIMPSSKAIPMPTYMYIYIYVGMYIIIYDYIYNYI